MRIPLAASIVYETLRGRMSAVQEEIVAAGSMLDFHEIVACCWLQR